MRYRCGVHCANIPILDVLEWDCGHKRHIEDARYFNGPPGDSGQRPLRNKHFTKGENDSKIEAIE